MRTFLLLLTLLLLPVHAAEFREAEQALQIKQFGKAAGLLDEYLASPDAKQADYAGYLKALALYQDKRAKEALQSCERVLEDFEDSKWKRKALFLKSRILIEQKKFKEAEEIYEAEANRLFSSDRKKDLAGVLVRFGDEMSRKPADDEIDAPAADFNKAIQLYNHALTMEIDRELRDLVLFKIAGCFRELSNWPEAEKRYREYLKQFDPKWAGPVGSPERFRGQLKENPLPAGKHWKEARFHLIEVQLAGAGQVVKVVAGNRHQALQVPQDARPQLGRLQMARHNAEDLLKLLGEKDDGMRSDIHWLLVRSFNMPYPVSTERDRGIKAARDFIEAFPSHPRATDTSRLIALTLRHAGQTDDAIAAFEEFASESNFRFVPEEEALDPNIKTGVSCNETFKGWTREAVFMIGQLRFEQKKYEEAIQQWREYIARFPNGAQWSDCQAGIINAQFQVGLDAVESKNFELARKHFDQFLKDHPLDGRARQILFTLGQMDYVRAQQLEEENEAADEEATAKVREHYRKAVGEWEKLVSKYPNTEESSLALYRIGVIQEEKLGELAQALATYQRLTWGSSAGNARQRFETMMNHSLAVRTERTFRTNEEVFIEVTSRNAPTLKLSQYRLNLEAYFRKTHGIGGIEDLDIDLIQPDKTWEVEVPGFEKYKPTTQRIKIPFDDGKPGVCVIKVSEEDFEATTLVIRSDIEIITKTSRRELLVYAQNLVTGKPAPGVSVIASNGKAVFGSGKTGKDGVFRKSFFETLKNASGVGVFASSNRGIASCNLSLQNLSFTSGLTARGYIYTEKPAYRPGETVNIRGIIRDVKAGSYVVDKGRKYRVQVLDPKGRMLKETIQALSEFGAFDDAIDIDSHAPLGSYTVTVSPKDGKGAEVFNGSFEVQRYKLEKVKLAMEFPRKVVFRGETIPATIRASYYWGSPAAGESIEYTLPDGRTYSEKTDEEGLIKIEFDPSGFLPGRHLDFSALAKRYNVTVKDQVFLANLGFKAVVTPSQPVALAGEPVDVEIRTTGADGEPVGKEMTLYVLRREVPAQDKILSAVPWIGRPALPAAEVTVEEVKVTTDEKTGKGTCQLRLEKGGVYVLRASGEDRFEQVVTAQNTMQVSDDEDAVKLRFFAEASRGKVGATFPLQLHSRLKESLALITVEGEEILSHRVAKLKPGYNKVDLELAHEHFPNFRVAVVAIDGRELRAASKEVVVERELKLEVNPRKQVELPGAESIVDLLVTDQNGKPVEAALSLALVNEALYSLYPEAAPSILDFFQSGSRRNAEFRNASTCGFDYVGRTTAVVKSIAEEKERLERRAKEIAKLAEMRASGGYGMGRDLFRARGEVAPSAPEIPGARFSNGGGGDFDQLKIQAESLEMASKLDDMAAQVVDQAEGKDGQQAMKPRKEVMEASRWVAPVITDAQGRAEVRLSLPESTTQWRLTARGCTRDSLVGQGTSSLITRKDFFVELMSPALVQEGDKMSFLAKIHNLTDFEGEVKVSLKLEGEQGFVAEQSVQVVGKSVTECVFDALEIPLVEAVTLSAEARGGKHADSLELEVPVRPWGIEYASSAGGVATGSVHGVVSLPEGREYSRQELEVSLSPSLRQALIDQALRGGMGSQADALLAAVSALKYATAHEAPGEEILVLRKRVQSLISALTATQNDDGSWGWQSVADLYHSCRSYWALALARQQGFPLQPDLLSKAEGYLGNRFSKLGANDNESKSMILHVLSVPGKADFAHLNRIHRERAGLSSNALARTAIAMSNMERGDFAKELVDLLEQKVKLEAPEGRPKLAWWDGGGRTVLQDRNEITALALLAIASVRPESPLAEQAANLLLRDQGSLYCRSPQALGSSVAALAAYYDRLDAEGADFEVTVMVNNRKLKTVRSADLGRRTVLEVPAKWIGKGENVIRFEKKGPGTFAYSVVLSGFSPEIKNPDAWGRYLRLSSLDYYHGNLSYRGVPLKAQSSSPVHKVELGQRIRVVSRVSNSYSEGRREYRVRREYLPAGMLLVEGSLSGNFQRHEVGDGVITMFYSPGKAIGDISYELVGYAPGEYRVLPGSVRDFYNRQRLTVGKSRKVVVLPPGGESDDPYKMNYAERYELARLNFDDGNFEVALKYLSYLFEKHRDSNEREVARMLLWIYTMDEHFDANRVVQMFEILRERHPSLTIPFDKILKVGSAYRMMEEYERAWLVFRATIDSSFINDASLSAVLEDQGQFLGSLEYMDRIWLEYPDTAAVVSAHFAISQQLYEKAPKAHELKAEEERRRRERGEDEVEDYDRIGLLKRSLDYLHRFLTHHPEDPLADDAAFSMANAYFALEDYETVVIAAEGFRELYPKSSFGTSFQYMAALGHFWQYHYKEALEAAAPVAESESKDRDYARYITAQVHHALGKPADAIEWYRKVKELYPDAGDAIRYFEEEKIEMDEVTTFKPDEEVEVELRFRNIEEAYLQIYRVDLMKLYLREKNLSNITKVHLAGIEPEFELTLDLGDGKDYRDRERLAKLPLKEEGAYLVICRGDDLFTSSMVLVTPLKLEIQETPSAGSLRVNVRDTVDEGYQAKVHVKAIGSNDSEFKSGDTDLRGIFVAEGLNGAATVIARQDGRYAFYRGTNHLGQRTQQGQPVPQQQELQQQLRQGDYLNNLIDSNDAIQRGNIDGWNKLRRGKGGKGVEVQQAR